METEAICEKKEEMSDGREREVSKSSVSEYIIRWIFMENTNIGFNSSNHP